MTAYRNSLVEIPNDKGIHIKSAGAKGEKYVNKYVKDFRNADGRLRNKAKVIGKYDLRTGRMYLNSNYFELYHLDPAMPDIDVLDYGYSYLVLKVCYDLRLMNSLTHAFGDHAMDVIIMAAYIIREGNAMDGLDDWQARNFFPEHTYLITSQMTSRIFASITDRQKENFFARWIKTAFHDGSVFYDVTSISSYSDGMPWVERGYNRDGDDLPQYNIGMFCDEESRLPLYYNRYNGSLTDKANLS